MGYFWAINRSYDVTYRLLDYTSRGYAHHLEFSGKPRPGTDFYAILYGVQDRGVAGANHSQTSTADFHQGRRESPFWAMAGRRTPKSTT